MSIRRNIKIVLLQTAIGDYRQKVLDILVSDLGNNFYVMAGREYFDPTVKTGISLGARFSFAKNHFFLQRKLLFQTGIWRRALQADVLIMEMNPRIISVWCLLFLRKMFFKPTVLWGHAWPREGKYSRSDYVRHMLRSLGDVIIVYTETQASELRLRMPHKKIVAAPNALYSVKDMRASDSANIRDFIYVGRLVSTKKPSLLLKAWEMAIEELPTDSRLVFVGDGPEKTHLEKQVVEKRLQKRVIFTGHISDLEKLRALYANSLASVSPGYVGLSITQSFAFGVPMIIARDENHSPEIEAAVAEVNSHFFNSDSPEDLARVLVKIDKERDLWMKKRATIADDCISRYSAELMARRIIEAVTF